jgi:predicted Zn-dependent protease
MKKFQFGFALLLASIFLISACQEVPVTGRRQLALVPSSQMLSMSAGSYNDFLKENNQKVLKGTKDSEMISRVGTRVKFAVEEYMKEKGLGSRLEGFNWEFNLIDDETMNAWAMPGGKVVFYTGILPVCKSETGIAVVMGHEVAHAIAEHGNERMTQQLAIQGLLTTGNVAVALEKNPKQSHSMLLQAFGVGSQLGLLAFSRKQESEADQIGLRFMAIAGYNPQEASQLWVRMKALSSGQAPPPFMSTHPSHDSRIAELARLAPGEMQYYNNSKFRKN